MEKRVCSTLYFLRQYLRQHQHLVGEDLGPVEPWVRDYLRDRGLLGTSILWFEIDPGNRGPLRAEQWRELCLSSVTTHDLPPTPGYLAGDHVRLRHELGLLTRPADDELADDRAAQAAWMAELRRVGLLGAEADEEDVVIGLYRYLGRTRSRLLALALLAAAPAGAVQPDEVLPDPVLEARARELSQNLRCLVCRNESIDESHADLARDLRLLLRERLVAGDSDDEAMAFIVDRYGEYVLLTPTTGGSNLILWIAGPAMLGAGGLIAALYLRRRGRGDGPGAEALTEDESRRLAEILKR